MKKFLLVAGVALLSVGVRAQIGINTEIPQATLDLKYNENKPTQAQGLVLTKMTTSQRDNMQDVPIGTVIYNLEKQCIDFYDGSFWICLKSITKPDASLAATEDILLGWDTYNLNGKEVELNVNGPRGESYPAYTSPQIDLPTIDGNTLKVSLTYPAGTVKGDKIIATLQTEGAAGYAPKLIYDEASAEQREIPLSFKGVTQSTTLKLKIGLNAVKNTEHGKPFLYPVVKIGDKYLTNINLGAKYAELAATNPMVLKEWASNSNWQTDYKAYGSLFQWQRKADGHELINWTSSTNGTSVNGTTDQLASSWTDAGTNKFIITKDKANWVIDGWNNSQAELLWKSGGVNNPCPRGYHVIDNKDWKAIDQVIPGNRDKWWNSIKLRLTAVGSHNYNNGTLSGQGSGGNYWFTDKGKRGRTAFAFYLEDPNSIWGYESYNAYGFAIRCIKD